MKLSLDNKNRGKSLIFSIAAGISVFALFLRFDKLANHELWTDELKQLNTMSGSLSYLIKVLPAGEQSSYLNLDHFLIYPFFKIFFFNKWGLAIPHIVITILGFYLLYLIGRRYFKTIWGYIITFGVVFFNASLINHATEVRPYAVLPTMALASLYFSEALVNEINLSAVKKFFIGAFFLLTICFHTYGFFILFFSLVYALLNKPKARSFSDILKRTYKIFIVVLAIGLPFWLFCLFGPLRYPIELDKLDVFAYFPNPAVNLLGFLKSIFGNLVGFKKFYFLMIALIFPFVFPYKERFKQISFLIIMVVLPVLLVFACDIVVQCYFIQRQFIWVMPYFAIFLGWSCDSSIGYIPELKRNLRREKR